MSYCYHPLKAIDFGIVPETGKHNIKILKGKYDPDEKCPFPNAKYIPLPCGHCIGCRLKYSRDWADRCMLEAQYHKHNWFLTLTYDNAHLPEPYVREVPEYDSSGELISTKLEISPINPLKKRDLQLFIKRFRKELIKQYELESGLSKDDLEYDPPRVRYFACGEYGSLSGRCHFHIILFGAKLDDVLVHHRDLDSSNVYFTSDTVKRCWYPESDSELPSEQRSTNGYHLLTTVSWETCAYVARYVMKKQKGAGSKVYEDLNFPPEFTLMSRKPGIGKMFYDDHNDIVIKDYYIPTKNGHRIVKSNRYFDKLFDIDYPNDLECIKEERLKAAELNEKLKTNLTSLNYAERLAAEEENKLASIKSLKRKEV